MSDVTSAAARVVGIPRKCIASEHRNSRIEERNTLRPSAVLLYGVNPAPFNWISHLPTAAEKQIDNKQQVLAHTRTSLHFYCSTGLARFDRVIRVKIRARQMPSFSSR